MSNSRLDSEPAALSAVATIEAIIPWTKPVTGALADRDQQAESVQNMTEDVSPREPASPARKKRPWYQRLLEIAAHNPPHLL
jgi:hypothetical protein